MYFLGRVSKGREKEEKIPKYTYRGVVDLVSLIVVGLLLK